LDLYGLGLLLPVFCIISHVAIHVRDSESHAQFADWRAPVKVSSSLDYSYSILQTLQFQVSTRRLLPSGTGMNHY
jgi:hypothetical protein